MFGRVAEVIARLKRTWAEELDDESIRQACHEAGHEWRERKLDPVTTVRLFLLPWPRATLCPRRAAIPTS